MQQQHKYPLLPHRQHVEMAEERQANDGKRLEDVSPRVRAELQLQLRLGGDVIGLDAPVPDLIGQPVDGERERERDRSSESMDE